MTATPRRVPRWPDRGWDSIVDALEADLAALTPDYEALQCKEKFGTLRYYVNYRSFTCPREPVDAAIQDAEAASGVICEVCGRPGQLRYRGGGMVVKTLCPTCADDHRGRQWLLDPVGWPGVNGETS